MGENTNIAWAHHSWNPWVGCTKVSKACDNCYAAAWDKRYGGEHWGPGAPRRRTSPANWRKPLKWNREAEASGEVCRVFCASLADVFDNEVLAAWRADLFKLIKVTPALTWMLLTKRIGNAAKMLPADWGGGYPNVWLGATIPNQAEADRDVPKLIEIPAAKRFVSYEPALGPVDFGQTGAWFNEWGVTFLDWIICGGESGAGRRPMDRDWARSVRAQCADAGVAFFYKQGNGLRPGQDDELDGHRHKEFPA